MKKKKQSKKMEEKKQIKEHIICALVNLDDLGKIIQDRCLSRAVKELEAALAILNNKPRALSGFSF